jgi:O-antigen ligase
MKGLLFTYLLTYGGALVSLFNPYVGLLIYVCFAIVRPEQMWYWSVPQGNYSRIVAIALLAGWAMKGFGRWEFGRARPIVLALLGFWLWSVVGAGSAGNSELAWGFVEDITKIVLPFLVGITLIDSIGKLKQLAWVILLSEGYLALEFNLSYFSGYNRLWLEGFGSMDNNCNAIALVTCVGLAFFLGLDAPDWKAKALALACAAVMTHAILFSFSRGGMLGLMVTGVTAFILLPKQPRHYFMFAAAVLLVLRLAGPEVLARFGTAFADSGERDASAESRVQLWSACLDSMAKQPLGVGPAQWGEVVPQYGFPRGKLAHTLWLQIGAELGIPGLLCLMLFYGLCVARVWGIARGRYPDIDPWFPVGARMVVAALVGFAVSAQFVSLDRLEMPYYITLIGAGILKLSSAPQTLPATVQPCAAIRPLPSWASSYR